MLVCIYGCLTKRNSFSITCGSDSLNDVKYYNVKSKWGSKIIGGVAKVVSLDRWRHELES